MRFAHTSLTAQMSRVIGFTGVFLQLMRTLARTKFPFSTQLAKVNISMRDLEIPRFEETKSSQIHTRNILLPSPRKVLYLH